MDAVILCGGRGKRMGALTEQMPKALLRLTDGDRLIDPIVRYLLEAEASTVHLACGYLAEDIKQHIRRRGYPACNIIVQTSEIGTAADGLLSVAEHIHSDFMVVHGDHYFSHNPVPALIAAHIPGNITFLIETAGQSGNLGGYSISCFYQPGSMSVSFVRTGSNPDVEMALVDGCMVLPPEIFDLIKTARAAIGGKPEMRAVFRYIAERGLAKMAGVINSGWYANINGPEALDEVKARILSEKKAGPASC